MLLIALTIFAKIKRSSTQTGMMTPVAGLK
jgi:hypothetical protein